MEQQDSPAFDIDGLLFDMDGTLVDTEEHWHAAEQWIANDYGDGREASPNPHLVGSTIREGAAHLRDKRGVHLSEAEIEALIVDYVIGKIRTGFAWKPGALALLTEAEEAGIPCALVTTATSEVADTVIEHLPGDTFQTVIAGDHVEVGKPDPEPYRLAATRLGVQPERCLVIEDSLTGATSGHAAGCRVIVAPERVTVPPSDRLAVVDTLQGWTISTLVSLVDSAPQQRTTGSWATQT